MLQPRPPAAERRSADLLLRMHVLPHVRARGPSRQVPELRRRARGAPAQARREAREIRRLGEARLQARGLQEMSCPLCVAESVVAENALAYVRVDDHALSRGHVLVVPKRHVADFFEMTADEQAAIVELLREAHER